MIAEFAHARTGRSLLSSCSTPAHRTSRLGGPGAVAIAGLLPKISIWDSRQSAMLRSRSIYRVRSRIAPPAAPRA